MCISDLQTEFGLVNQFIGCSQVVTTNNYTTLKILSLYHTKLTFYICVRFEVFTEVTMKNAVFWDVAPCRCYFNRRFGGTYRLHLQGIRNPRERNQREQVAAVCSSLYMCRLGTKPIETSFNLVEYFCTRYPATSSLPRICLRGHVFSERLPSSASQYFNLHL
jgi:hypothetical protein